jgi:hypothetical protein
MLCSITFFFLENLVVYEKNGRILQRRTGHKWQYDACAFNAGYLRLQTYNNNMLYLLLFHYNNGCTKAPQCYVIRTLTVLLYYNDTRAENVTKHIHQRETRMWADSPSHLSAVQKFYQLVQRHTDMVGQSEITTIDSPSAVLFRLYMTNRGTVAWQFTGRTRGHQRQGSNWSSSTRNWSIIIDKEVIDRHRQESNW